MIDALIIAAMVALPLLAWIAAVTIERHRNAARVECAQCELHLEPLTLETAMYQAKVHKDSHHGHHALVVKA